MPRRPRLDSPPCVESSVTSAAQRRRPALSTWSSEGSRRLEYRGYDSAGVALVGPADARDRARRRGKLGQPRRGARTAPAAARRRPAIGHTRWATHGGPTDVNAHPHRGGSDGKLAVIHNGIIENFARAQGRAGRRRRRSSRSETDTEVAAQLLARAFDETGDLTDGDAPAVARTLDGTFTLLAVHADAPDVVVGARHDSPAGRRARRRARTSSAPTSPRSSRTRARRSSSARTRSSTITPGLGRASPTSTARPSRRKPLHRRLGRRGRREGRLRRLHGQGDPRPAARGRGHPARPHRRSRAGWSSTSCGSTSPCCGPSTRSSSSRAAPPPTPGMSPSTRSSTGAASPSRSSWRTSSATATRSSTSGRWSSRSAQSGETMDTLMAVRHAREQGAKVIAIVQHPRLDDPARVRRRALHARRPGDRGRLHQGVPRADHRRLPARPLPRPAARQQVRRRGRARSSPSCARCRTRSRPVLDRCRPGPRGRPVDGGHDVGAVPRAGTSASRWRWRARSSSRSSPTSTPRASPPASSSTGRSRSSSEGQPVFVIVPSPARPRLAAPQGRLQHPGDPRPRRPHPRHRRGRRRGRAARTPTRSSACRSRRRCSRRC